MKVLRFNQGIKSVNFVLDAEEKAKALKIARAKAMVEARERATEIARVNNVVLDENPEIKEPSPPTNPCISVHRVPGTRKAKCEGYSNASLQNARGKRTTNAIAISGVQRTRLCITAREGSTRTTGQQRQTRGLPHGMGIPANFDLLFRRHLLH